MRNQFVKDIIFFINNKYEIKTRFFTEFFFNQISFFCFLIQKIDLVGYFMTKKKISIST